MIVDTLSPRDAAALRAELTEVIDSITDGFDRGGFPPSTEKKAAWKRGIAYTILASQEAAITEG